MSEVGQLTKARIAPSKETNECRKDVFLGPEEIYKVQIGQSFFESMQHAFIIPLPKTKKTTRNGT